MGSGFRSIRKAKENIKPNASAFGYLLLSVSAKLRTRCSLRGLPVFQNLCFSDRLICLFPAQLYKWIWF
uniref:Uncharacterized protein n=1 Tax=Candidatus Kentrum sp. SD TaxID=2126332 RepID=A0A450YD39_9GAMM|nr:MAG: hypothetical protein BECKSD772F_GA0070984_10383 [Candidatus Kentron sp. SD]VFK41050.1 MAG: hypothetical protein BECKSD772E_GA0070983_100920 [Candidatus Kentron sp. SD]